MVTNPFTVIQGLRSWSPPQCRLLLWNRVLEPSLNIRVIYICNFRLRVYTFLLVFFDSLAGTAFLARSIKLCLVDNQRSSGVTVAGFESCWFEAGSRTSSSPQSNLSTTSRKIGPGHITSARLRRASGGRAWWPPYSFPALACVPTPFLSLSLSFFFLIQRVQAWSNGHNHLIPLRLTFC